jgi:DNA-binding NarL/FixJ family response regulator
LIHAIRAVACGRQFLSPHAEEYFGRCTAERRKVGLAPQEVSTLILLAQGLGTQAIADELGIDPRTVQGYINALLRKTGCSERTQLANWYRSVFRPPEE